jgi:predicted ABC-type ATPase
MANSEPVLYLFGGCNGAGKTTFAKRFLPAAGVEIFLNADEIARGLSPLKVELAAMRAGRLLLTLAHEFIAKKQSFGLESTLSGKTHVHLLNEARAAGYVIELHFLVVPSAEFSQQRVAQRVAKGGHDVPRADIQRRFERITQNFLELYVPLAQRWSVWDNSQGEPLTLAQSEDTDLETLKRLLIMNTSTTVRESRLPEWLVRAKQAAELAYQDALAENKRWGLPMIPPVKAAKVSKHKKAAR